MLGRVADVAWLLLLGSCSLACKGGSSSGALESDNQGNSQTVPEDDPPPDAYADALAAVGDFDGDGDADLAVGAPYWGSSDKGIAELRFLDAGQEKQALETITKRKNGFTGRIDDHDWLGAAVASLGDLDGDAVVDLAVGAPGDGDGGRDTGAVWILFLERPTGYVARQQKLSALEGNLTAALDRVGRFGWSLATVGDLDGDGVVELAAGAPRDDEGDFNAGAVWILFLATDGTVRSSQKIAAASGGFAAPLLRQTRLGSALAPLGDFDGDAVPDLIAGVPFDQDGGFRAGAVWLLLLHPDGTVKAQRKINASHGGFAGPLAERDRFGSAVASLGDLDGDGTTDIAAGAESETREINPGVVWILFLAPDGSVRRQLRLGSGEGGMPALLRKHHRFGSSLAAPGDLDGDAVPDLVAGAPGQGSGHLWFLFLNRDGTVRMAKEQSRSGS